MDIRIISCLFVKFVLYTAGFLGEGTLLIFNQTAPNMINFSYLRAIYLK